MIRILIVDDHDIVRDGVRQIVSETSDIELGGEATTGAGGLDKVREGGWDVVLLDLNLPDRSGIDLLGQIRAIAPSLPILVFTMHREETYASRVLKAGARGYVSKDRAREHLVEAIRRLARGERYLTPDLAQRLANDMLSGRPGSEHEELSDREFQVLIRIASGMPPREIASALGISVKTVATHRARILQKTGLRNNAEIVQYALEHHLLE